MCWKASKVVLDYANDCAECRNLCVVVFSVCESFCRKLRPRRREAVVCTGTLPGTRLLLGSCAIHLTLDFLFEPATVQVLAAYEPFSQLYRAPITSLQPSKLHLDIGYVPPTDTGSLCLAVDSTRTAVPGLFRSLVRRSGTQCQMSSDIRHVMLTASNSSLNFIVHF